MQIYKMFLKKQNKLLKNVNLFFVNIKLKLKSNLGMLFNFIIFAARKIYYSPNRLFNISCVESSSDVCLILPFA